VDEVRRLGFIDSRVVGRWKDELMRMKTDDVVRSSGSIVYWGGGCAGQWGCAHSRAGLRLVYSRRRPKPGRQAAAIMEAAEALC